MHFEKKPELSHRWPTSHQTNIPHLGPRWGACATVVLIVATVVEVVDLVVVALCVVLFSVGGTVTI